MYDIKKDDIIYIETVKATNTDYVNCGASNNNLTDVYFYFLLMNRPNFRVFFNFLRLPLD